ncbi:TonB-dependent receptor [Mucilaginibacter auburnensis]|uniref:Iron complex outermembrane receptor protein n=1 Tax=Mucilaginibacter auburnensis TaxID=1457233 RepID=A0A2H9VLW6_9SPHI|nr:TonB-dependent receptor [Mucilaginibacter auburnensis]PJJ79314.1 iron complex outermembrane receptor protein [Mucilaginibacter auburnensis]
MKLISKTVKLLLLIFLVYSSSTAYAQLVVTGVVKNSKGAAVPHATVTVRGTKISVAADEQGAFSITPNLEPPFYLQVKSVGFKAQDFQVLSSKTTSLELELVEDDLLGEIVVTSRRRKELLQDVPIPVSVVGGSQIDQAGAFNVNYVKQFVPSLQLYTSNPRNTGINIRGIGSPFGLTNDGLDPGVGVYVDGVYYARPAVATFDFIDVENIEVLRGPQGTLFGKNTAAGAFNITTRKPSFTPGYTFETSFGNFGYIQAKAAITGPLSKTIAARVSFSGTQRDGLVQNIRTGRATNDLNNLGARVQFLYKPSDNVAITLAGDASDQKPDGYAQVIAGVAPTKRPAYRQFNNIIADLKYTLPSYNAFDRVIDHDTPWRSGNQLGGVSLNGDFKIGPGTLTSTTAYRYWNWDPSNDRDFTGLPVLQKSQNPAKHHNWSQEVRYAGTFNEKLSGVVGIFYLDQEVKITGTEESGSAQWRFSQSQTGSTGAPTGYTWDQLWATPDLLEGYGIYTNASIKSKSAAAFASVDYEVFKNFHIVPGARINYDKKDVYYDRQARGGLDIAKTTYNDDVKAALQKIKSGVYSSQNYATNIDENNFTYSITAAYRPSTRLNAFATYSTSYKPVGVNVAGLPSPEAGKTILDYAVIKPEKTKHYEIGFKSTPFTNFIFNLTFHNSDIDNYQTNVQSADLTVNRGYIANAEKVNVKGVELDASFRVDKNFSFYAAGAWTDAKYVKFTNAPLPLEETGQLPPFKDVSGGALPGVSKWAGSLGGEFATNYAFLGNNTSQFFVAVDGSFRSSFSSSASPSAYLNIAGYGLLNARLGFKATHGFSTYIWSRNLLNQNYFEQLLPAGGNAGHYAGVLGDQRTLGITLRYSL